MFFISIADFITIILTACSAVLALLIGGRKLISFHEESGSAWLCVAMGLISVWRTEDIFYYLYLFKSIAYYPFYFGCFATVALLFSAPFFYLYINRSIDEELENTPKPYWNHFIIPIILSILFVTGVIGSHLVWIRLDIVDAMSSALIFIGAIIYMVYAVILLLKLMRYFSFLNSIDVRVFSVNLITILLIFVTIISYFLGSKLIFSAFFLVVLGMFFILGSFYYKTMQIVHELSMREKYSKSHINDLDVDEILQVVENLIIEQQVYRDENLSLKSFSEKLGLTPHQVSELLNSRIGTSFPNFIATHRVKAAQSILVKDQDAAIIAVGYEVGFNSVSSFYAAFKKYTGMSPGKFKYQHLAK